MMLGPGKWANALRDAAAKEFAGQAVAGAEGQGDNKDAHRARLKQLESLCGNSITLSALLMHNWNFWHMRLIMQRLHLFAKEQGFNATQKKTPNQHLSTSVRLACGRGEVLLGDIWAYVVCDKGKLARLGVKATPVTAPQDFSLEEDEQFGTHPGLEADTSPGRLVGFPGHLLQKHYQQYEYKTNSWPIRFAGLLHGAKNIPAEQWETHKDLWEYTCAIESAAKDWSGPATLRAKAIFMDRAHMQLILRLLDHIVSQQDHQAVPTLVALIRRRHHRIKDLVVVEKSANSAGKATYHDQEHQQVGACNLLHQLRQAKRNPLAERDMQEVVVPDSDWDAEVKGKQSWSKMVHVSTCLDPEWGAKACFLHKAATCSLRTQACTDGTAAAVVHRKQWQRGWRRMASMCCCCPSFGEGHPSRQLLLGASCCSRWCC